VVAWVILVATSYPWQSSSYFTGTATGSQTLKAACIGLALCLAAIGFATGRERFDRPLTPVLLVAGCAVTSIVGAALPNTSLVSTSSNVIAAAKIVVVFVAAHLCARTLRVRTLWNALLGMVAGVMVLAIIETYVLGLPRYKGRLSLYHPAIPPNAIAIGAGLVTLHFGVQWLRGRTLSLVGTLGILLSLATLVGTGTRGALVAIGIGILAVALTTVLHSGRLAALLFVALGVLLATLFAAHGAPGQFTRSSQVGVLDSRSTDWSAVLHGPRTTSSWIFGNGANNGLVAIPFNGWATAAPVNDAWLMAFFQNGLIGVLALGAYFVFIGRRVFRAATGDRPVLVGVFAALCLWSITEAGMLSVSINGLILLALAYWAADAVAATGPAATGPATTGPAAPAEAQPTTARAAGSLRTASLADREIGAGPLR
jgi:hypothetical protein